MAIYDSCITVFYAFYRAMTNLLHYSIATVRQQYYNYIRFLQDQDELVPCERGKSPRELPEDCQESALTPTELFAKLDDWDFPYLTIPHGSAWGFYTPALSSWDKQLAAQTDPERHEPLIEIFSGHGNSEYYRPWRAVAVDKNGNSYCPEPTPDFLPECWQAGEIIRSRCLAAGESVQSVNTGLQAHATISS